MARKEIALDVKVNGADDADDRLLQLDNRLSELINSMGQLNESMKKGFKSGKDGADAAGKGVKGFTSSIGGLLKSLGLIAVAMEVFNYLRELLMKNQKVADGLAKAFVAIEVVFNNVAVAVENLIDDLRSLSSFSITDIWNAFKNFGQAVSNAGENALSTADKIVKLRNEVKLAEAQQRLLLYQYQREAEIQRQIRDDVSKTIAERQAANTKLGEILDEQTKEELKLANKRKELAELELSINKSSIDAKVAVIDAEKEIADIQERITGQRSEQLVNENSLRRESIEIMKARKAALEAEAEAEAEAAFKIATAKINAQKTLDDYLSERESLSRSEIIQKEIDDALAAEELKYQNAINAATQMGALQEEMDNIELAHLEETLRIENEIRDKYNAEQLALEEDINQKLKDQYDEDVAATKEAEEAKRKIREAGIDAASDVLSSLGQLIAASGKKSKDAVVFQKTLAIAQIAIDTAKGISGAIAQAQDVPFPANLAAMATGVAAVISGIASAITTINSVNIGGGTASQPTASVATVAPAIQQPTFATTELGNTQQAQLAPIQAFVVETELTGTQQNINQIQSQATFGFG